jgi:Dolichyl-phosphate-mannose-protein mannosyltransferase/F5/8 type C domain
VGRAFVPAERSTRAMLVILVGGALVRLALLRVPWLWHDEATTGVMALAVLRGQFPLYFFGQPFMGALGDAYLAAPLFILFGVSARTLELVPVVLSLLWLVLMARFALEAFGRRAALFSVLVLAVPPDYLLSWAHEARPHYVLILPLGTLALLLVLRASQLPPRRATLAFGVLGLVLGLAFWTNFLSVVYIPAVATVALSLGPARRHLGSALAAGPGFLLGSLPHWLYGLAHGTAVPHVGGRIDPAALVAHLRAFAQTAWPIVAGVPAPWRGTAIGVALSVTLAVVYALALVASVRGHPADPPPHRAAGRALAVLVAVTVGLAVGSVYGRALVRDPRYLLPVYVALPLLLGRWLASLPSRRLAAGLTGALVLVHAAGGLSGSFRNMLPSVAAWERAELERQLATVVALKRQGVDRLYGPGWQRTLINLTFLSAERVIFSDPYEEINPRYALMVDGADQAAWGVHERNLVWEENLRALGIAFTFQPAGPLGGVYRDFVLDGQAVRELDPSGWRVATSHQPELAHRLVDRDGSTLWRSRAQQGGEWVQVDLGQVERVALVRWLPGFHGEVPTGVALHGSLDGRTWERLLDLATYRGPLYWSAGRPMRRVRSGRVELRIPPTPLRHLRIVQTGRQARFGWSMRELFVYAASGAPAHTPTVSGARLAAALRGAGVTRLYADHGWGSRVALADPEIRVLPANLGLDAYGFEGAARDLLPPVRWRPGVAVLLESTDADGFLRAARVAGLGFTEREVGGLRLFVHAPRPPRAGLPVRAEKLRASGFPRPEAAALALDGDRRTAWTTGRSQRVEDWFRVDLPGPQTIRAVRLWTGDRTAWPRGLAVEGSVDGVTWQSLATDVSTQGPHRWGGIALLRDGVEAVRLDFGPATLSALRVRLTRDDRDEWSINELSVFADE